MMRDQIEIDKIKESVRRDERILNLEQGAQRTKQMILATLFCSFLFFLAGKYFHQLFFALFVISLGAAFGQYNFLLKSFERALVLARLPVNSIETPTEE